jgi:hypothetical protein
MRPAGLSPWPGRGWLSREPVCDRPPKGHAPQSPEGYHIEAGLVSPHASWCTLCQGDLSLPRGTAIGVLTEHSCPPCTGSSPPLSPHDPVSLCMYRYKSQAIRSLTPALGEGARSGTLIARQGRQGVLPDRHRIMSNTKIIIILLLRLEAMRSGGLQHRHVATLRTLTHCTVDTDVHRAIRQIRWPCPLNLRLMQPPSRYRLGMVTLSHLPTTLLPAPRIEALVSHPRDLW